MMLIDIDDERNSYIGDCGEYECWNIAPDVLAEGIDIKPEQWTAAIDALKKMSERR